MCQKMVSDVVVFCKAPVTHLAPEGPATTVDKLVRFQIAGCRERFLAVATFVRFVLEMFFFVILEIAEPLVWVISCSFIEKLLHQNLFEN